MKIRLLLLFFSLVLVFPQLEAFLGCGDDALTKNLTDAATRAAGWLGENLLSNTTETEGHILGTAYHSLRLVDYPLCSLTNHPTSTIYKDFNVKETDSGKVALYVHGYLATGQPLKKEFIKRLKAGVKCCDPFSHPFQYLTTVLALCNCRYPLNPHRIRRIIKTTSLSLYQYQSIDTVALGIIALSCLKRKQAYKTKRVPHWIQGRTKWLLKRQNADGSFGGNAITTALAAQAIISNTKWAKLKWKCSKTMKYLLSHQKDDGSFGDLMSTIQILPVLKGKVPHDLKQGNCSLVNSTEAKINSTKASREENDATEGKKPVIRVCLKIHFDETGSNQSQFDVQVKQGSTVHKIFKMASKQHENQFTFKATETKYGAMIQSIGGVKEDRCKRLHWIMFTSPVTMATVGVDSLRPENGACVIFRLMKTGDESLTCGKCQKEEKKGKQ